MQLHEAENTLAAAQKAHLEKKQSDTGPLTQEESSALDKANATLARHAPRDRGPLPAIPDARRDIQDLSAKAAAGGTLNADEAHQLAHAQRAIAQQRVNDLAAAEANGTLTAPQRRQLDRFREILAASPYGTELPKGPPPGYDPHATNPAHREWYPPNGDTPDHPTNAEFTPDALAHSSQDIKTTIEEMNREGHAVSRHGPEVTEGQLRDRAMHSIDPITETRQDGVHGRDHSGTATATQFTSKRSLVHAYKTVTNNPDFKEKIKTAKEHNRTNPGDPQDYVVFDDLSLESVFGPSYEKHVRGQTRVGPKNNPTGNIKTPMAGYKIKAVYKLDPATGEYHLHTMYPNKP